MKPLQIQNSRYCWETIQVIEIVNTYREMLEGEICSTFIYFPYDLTESYKLLPWFTFSTDIYQIFFSIKIIFRSKTFPKHYTKTNLPGTTFDVCRHNRKIDTGVNGPPIGQHKKNKISGTGQQCKPVHKKCIFRRTSFSRSDRDVRGPRRGSRYTQTRPDQRGLLRKYRTLQKYPKSKNSIRSTELIFN